MSKPASLAKARGKSRTLAMQAIYQWQMTGDDIAIIEKQFLDDNNAESLDVEYFSSLLHGIVSEADTIDKCVEKYMDRLINSVDPVERSILRLGCYEFMKCLDVPYRVVLNEAVNLTKKFCAEQSHTFVNAVLDKVAHELRSDEIKGD